MSKQAIIDCDVEKMKSLITDIDIKIRECINNLFTQNDLNKFARLKIIQDELIYELKRQNGQG